MQAFDILLILNGLVALIGLLGALKDRNTINKMRGTRK